MINLQAAAVPHSSTFQDAYTSYVSMAQVKPKGYKVRLTSRSLKCLCAEQEVECNR